MPNQLNLKTQGGISGGGGFRGSQIQKSWEAVKRLDRLAPYLVHVCGFVWEWTYAKYNSSLDIGGGLLGGQQLKSQGEMSNGWSDWHQLWFTSVDSSGNGHRLKQLAPRYHRAAFWVVLWDQPFKRLKLWSNDWTDWESILHI